MNTPNFRVPYGTLALDGLDVAYVPESIHIAGDNEMGAELQMANHRIVHLASGTAPTDAVSLGQLTEQIATVEQYVGSREAILQAYVDTRVDFVQDQVTVTDGNVDLMNTRLNTVQDIVNSYGIVGIDVNGNPIRRLLDGELPTDAANFGQVVDGDAAVTSAFIAADALKLNRSGVGAMTGALDMGGFLIQQVNAGGTGSTNAANVFQMEAADTVVTNARIAGDAAVTTAYIAADTVVTNARIAADAVVTSNYIAADSVVAANASAALTTEVNARVASVGAEATTRAAQDASITSSYIAANTAQTTAITNAYVAADVVVTNARIAGDATVTTAYIAADAVVTNDSVQKTGSTMSGTLTINNIQTCLQATHTAASLIMTMQGGSSTVPNAALIRMTAGLGAGLEFYDYIGALMGYMRFDFNNTPDRIVFNVGGTSTLILQSAAAIFSQPLAMSTKQITGLQAGSATSHAVNYGQTMLRSGVNAMTADLNMDTHKITGVADATNPQDVVVKNQVLLLNGTQAMGGTLDMNGQTVNRVYSLNSNGTLPMYVTNDGVAVAEFNSSGMTMSSGKNINLNFQKILYLADSVDNYDAVTRIQIANSAIPLVAWRSGETIQRKWLSPALGSGLTNSSCTKAQVDRVIVTTTMTVTIGNKVFVKGSFNISADGYGDDKFTMRAEHNNQYMDFANVIPTSSGFRERTYHFNALFIPSSSGSKTIGWRIYNQTDSDTLTITASNWEFSIEEVQS